MFELTVPDLYNVYFYLIGTYKEKFSKHIGFNYFMLFWCSGTTVGTLTMDQLPGVTLTIPEQQRDMNTVIFVTAP